MSIFVTDRAHEVQYSRSGRLPDSFEYEIIRNVVQDYCNKFGPLPEDYVALVKQSAQYTRLLTRAGQILPARAESPERTRSARPRLVFLER